MQINRFWRSRPCGNRRCALDGTDRIICQVRSVAGPPAGLRQPRRADRPVPSPIPGPAAVAGEAGIGRHHRVASSRCGPGPIRLMAADLDTNAVGSSGAAVVAAQPACVGWPISLRRGECNASTGCDASDGGMIERNVARMLERVRDRGRRLSVTGSPCRTSHLDHVSGAYLARLAVYVTARLPRAPRWLGVEKA